MWLFKHVEFRLLLDTFSGSFVYLGLFFLCWWSPDLFEMASVDNLCCSWSLECCKVNIDLANDCFGIVLGHSFWWLVTELLKLLLRDIYISIERQ